MRIAFVTFGNFSQHATLKRATGMASPLINSGHEVAILLEDAPDNREKVELECPDAAVFWHKRGKSGWEERRAKQKTLNEWKPDVVWICGVGLRNWMYRPSKDCILLADHSELYSRIQKTIIRHFFYYTIEWLYCLHFDGHICASRYLVDFYKRRLRKLGRTDRVHYSPYANHDGIITPQKNDNRLNLRLNNRKLLVYMGSFWENYGFWDLLNVFCQLSKERNDFVVSVIGRGPEKEKGIAWIQEQALSDVVRIEGYVAEEELPLYFSTAYAFLCPLRNTVQDWARCPSKLFMYLPFKRPVVTCKIGEASELFGEKGCYYEPGNQTSLLRIINQVLDHSGDFSIPNPEEHTYRARTEAFLTWLYSQYPCLSK